MTAAQLPVEVRRATDEDLPAILALMQTTLGWKPTDPNEQFFAWKHFESPFGRSPGWVAEVEGELVGFRTFMRWRFRDGNGVVEAVRAVDTATHPAHQGRGIFTKLTRHAIDEMTRESVGFVFNTPNDQSRPGYLKMGWSTVGRLPLAAYVAGPTGGLRMLRAKAPAELWSQSSTVADPAAAALDGVGDLTDLLSACAGDGLVTDRSVAFLRWRYGFAPLNYRLVAVDDEPQLGLAIFRLRRRGGALEAAVGELLVPETRTRRRLVRDILRSSGADYALSLGPVRVGVPVVGQGPLLTHRELTRPGRTSLAHWALSLGDVELF